MPFSPKLVRIVRRLLLSFAVFVTLIAVAVVIENWRGDRAWKRYAAEHAARGEILATLPEPTRLPSEVNFFKTPVIDRWIFDEKGEGFPQNISALNVNFTNDIVKAWRIGRDPDFKGIVEAIIKRQKMFAAKETALSPALTPAGQLLALLAPMDSLLIELRQAAKQRPESNLVQSALVGQELWTVWTGSLNSEFLEIVGKGLSLHASASLAEQKNEIAFDDIMAGLKFSRGFTSAPNAILIETLLGTMLLERTLQPIWQGLQHHAWSEEQLAKIQQELTRTDFFDSLDRAFRSEQALILNALEYMPPRELVHDMRERWIWRLIPRGWLQQNKIAYCVLSAPCRQMLAARGKPNFLNQLSNAGKYPKGFGRFTSPYMRIASVFVKGTDQLPQTVAPGQALLTLAQTACALERYRLVHGSYPVSLAELVPTYLEKAPVDIINGGPLHYGRTDNGKFFLYSIGLDGKDDGGKPIDIKQAIDAKGDWAWPQLVEG